MNVAVPGARAVICDDARRGVHHRNFLRSLGVSTVSRVTAARRVRNKDGTAVKRVDELVDVETKRVSPPAGPVDVRLFRIHKARSKAAAYRWYSDHRLPDEHGGGTITVRLHGDADDAKRTFNRTENLRPIPPDDPDFDRLHVRRNDAEGINRHLDDTVWLGRAHSIGRHRQGLNLLTNALCVNGLALRQPVDA